jgi:hypothetical protein
VHLIIECNIRILNGPPTFGSVMRKSALHTSVQDLKHKHLRTLEEYFT